MPHGSESQPWCNIGWQMPPLGSRTPAFSHPWEFLLHKHLFDCDSIEHIRCSRMFFHVIPPGQLCHPLSTGLATGVPQFLRLHVNGCCLREHCSWTISFSECYSQLLSMPPFRCLVNKGEVASLGSILKSIASLWSA